MLDKKLNKLFSHVGPILSLYNTATERETHEFSVTTFKNNTTAIVRITFTETSSFYWDFLEPLTAYCVAKNVVWEINTMEESIQISLSDS